MSCLGRRRYFVMLTCLRLSLPMTLRDCRPRLRIRLPLASLYLRMRSRRRRPHSQLMRVTKSLVRRAAPLLSDLSCTT